MQWFKIPFWLPWLMPSRLWRCPKYDPQCQACIYLTFDDGPIPEVTPWVLDQLDTYGAKATFFCIGENTQRHSDILQEIIKRGHKVGNHTQSHCKGTKTSTQNYLSQVRQFELSTGLKSKLFRPPYGRLTADQASGLTKLGYRIVMWDVLSYDWQKERSAELIFSQLKRYISPGSIVVFHDSLKAEKNLRAVLPKILEHINNKGITMALLSQD